MSDRVSVVVELEGEEHIAPGYERRRALTLLFALGLALGSAFVGRDGPVATPMYGASTVEPGTTVVSYSRNGLVVTSEPADRYLSLPSNTTGVLLSWIPDRLANEALPPLPFVPVRVRAVSGLAVEGLREGDYRMVTWTERGNVYWLVSNRGDVADLVRLADSLR